MGGTGGGTPGSDGRYSVSQTARIIGLSERAVRKRIDAGTLDAVRQGDGPWRVALPLDGTAGGGTEGGTRAAPVPPGGRYHVTPAEVEQAIERTGAKYVADMQTMFDRVGALYEGQLAAQRETIAELRRRAEAAEVERETLRRELAHAQQSQVSPGWWRRWWRGADHA